MEERQNGVSIAKIATGQLSDHERMSNDLLRLECRDELTIAAAKVVDPD